MKILRLEMNPVGIDRASMRLIVEGNVDYNLPSEILGKDYEVKIVPIKKKRTLTANAYYWTLLEKLAMTMRLSQTEVHEKMLRDYGQTLLDSKGNRVMFRLSPDVDPIQLGVHTDVVKSLKIKGKDYIIYRALKGSSEMDTKEFSYLLDGLIYECKEQGIETMTPSELLKLKGYVNGC